MHVYVVIVEWQGRAPERFTVSAEDLTHALHRITNVFGSILTAAQAVDVRLEH